jgi:Lrp/AsnC family transcriptional regulator
VVKDIESYDNFYKKLIEKVQFLKVTSNFAIEEIKSTTEIPLTAMEKTCLTLSSRKNFC